MLPQLVDLLLPGGLFALRRLLLLFLQMLLTHLSSLQLNDPAPQRLVLSLVECLLLLLGECLSLTFC